MRGASRPKTPGDDSMRASDGDHVLRGSLGVVETDRSKVEESEVEEPVNETTTMTDEGRAGTSDLGRSMGEDLVREGAAGTRADEGVERSLQGGAGRGSRAERSTEHSGLDDSLDESGHAILSLDRSMENVSPGSSVGRMEGATDLERSTESRGVRDGDDDAAKSPSTRSASHMSTPTDRGSQAPSEDRSGERELAFPRRVHEAARFKAGVCSMPLARFP